MRVKLKYWLCLRPPRHSFNFTLTPFIFDSGIKKEGFYDFPFLLKHEEGEWDCVLAKICKKGKLEYPVATIDKEFKDIYNDFIPLKHISEESVLFIDPSEEFSEDAVIKLKDNGIYRVISIFTAKDCECVCASKKFIIQKVS